MSDTVSATRCPVLRSRIGYAMPGTETVYRAERSAMSGGGADGATAQGGGGERERKRDREREGGSTPTVLRCCYAMSDTDIACAAPRWREREKSKSSELIRYALGSCYAMSGTDMLETLHFRYAMPGTDLGPCYTSATKCPAPTPGICSYQVADLEEQLLYQQQLLLHVSHSQSSKPKP
eukprot:2423217-Rhodomonas_salina.2